MFQVQRKRRKLSHAVAFSWVFHAAIAVSILCMTPVAKASTIVALSEPALSKAADAIAFGVIIDTRTTINDRSQVSTEGRFQVYKAVSGVAVGQIITVRVPGGELPNGLVAHTYGSPKLVAGAAYLGFFELRRGTYRPLGLGYGLLKTRKDAKGSYMVWRDTTGLAVLAPSGQEATADSYALRETPLDEYVARIRGHLAGTPLKPIDGPGGFAGPGTVRP